MHMAGFIFFSNTLLILSMPQLLLDLRDKIIFDISSGDVGLR